MAKGGSGTGRRYSPEERERILSFVREHDAANGRGGRSAAARKFGVSALSLSLWLKASGGVSAAKRRHASGAARISGGRGFEAKLRKLAALHRQIADAERRIDAMRRRFDSLKART